MPLFVGTMLGLTDVGCCLNGPETVLEVDDDEDISLPEDPALDDAEVVGIAFEFDGDVVESGPPVEIEEVDSDPVPVLDEDGE